MEAKGEMSKFSYALVPSAFGVVSIVWQQSGQGPRVHRVLLPNERRRTEQMTRAAFPNATPASAPAILELGERVQAFLNGKPVDFELAIAALDKCPAFQRRVLAAEHRIPRGWVSTYQRIARRLGLPRGARAVGRALARNPFPILIPCHRAIRSDGHLGGFQGGIEMKRALLELEGIRFSAAGKVLTDRVHY
jgi:methylated-DNA-[protein]-cysteine S-methyltransferase